ncbi:SDR family NAD(P)-dependent oxidoreductase (plasmid) [Halobaculum sp. CBA1158]|uniref:SDR family NAD(P)-dependent oxidoreductase n=1 Tax=Halobaculum sp. CBA1158 TaxID=2904243 RepID=UPI001F24EE11|nr:SDR family NAD(P)-dependent oxidoreductase [Halobaculum sp. CBA1158]UIP01355.1 SDR family NAD(P)-dependent oxidoreductase [Halobaculum sp. CBA1158]
MTEHATDDRVVVLTGGTSGIGRVAARNLAAGGATVAVVGRDRERGADVADADAGDTSGEVWFHRADLATKSAVRDLAAELRDAYDRIDALVHNAGLSVDARTETADGIELTLAVNHLAPYLLTHELFDMLAASAPARVVVTASDVHRRATLALDDLQLTREYDALAAYARSKLATIAFTLELADRIPDDAGVTANCVHPGFVPSTGLFRDAPLRTRLAVRVAGLIPGVGTTVEDAAGRVCRLVTDERFGETTGAYVVDGEPASPASEAADPGIRARLWTASADLVGVDPDWP